MSLDSEDTSPAKPNLSQSVCATAIRSCIDALSEVRF